ncbi:LytTr DNA-binding domain [butyrate-producing bacterium SS3/4]|nr:LytTr DNA-binding domain [butyrate-producing bacterium SS3/4]
MQNNYEPQYVVIAQTKEKTLKKLEKSVDFSVDKRTELVCVDRVVSCNYIYRELKERLPEVFYPLRRGYLVNTLYIVALRRFEAELISGISIPIPALTYTQVKRDLQELIEKK